MKKRILAIILTAVMLVGMLPLGAVPAFAENAPDGTDKYIARSWDSTKKQVISTEEDIPQDAKEITADTRELLDGWYVLSESVTLPEGKHITVSGDAHLVLFDGCELKIPSPNHGDAAIELESGNSLTVYGQKNGTGTVTATGSSAAGIGSSSGDNCGKITISGGIVTATGGYGAAGIGGGSEGDCGDIKIYGGTVTATGGNRGAGIGNGYEGNGGSITVYGGTVKAYGNNSRALGGDSSTFFKNKIHIYGGDILADSKSSNDAVIAYSVKVYADSHNIFTVKDANGTALPLSPVTEEKDLYKDLSGNKILHIEMQPAHTFDEYVDNGDGTHYGICVCGAYGNNEPHSFNEETGKCICGVSSDDCLEYRYYDEESGEFKSGYCSEYELIDKYFPAEWQGGKWYVVKGEVSISKRITVRKGDGTGVKLILTDGCKLILPNGISVNKTDNDENTLTIYGQSGGTGELLAGCREFTLAVDDNDKLLAGGSDRDFNFTHAGIGGNAEHDSGTVNIHGGVVTARSYRGAGIGGGCSNTGNGGSGSVNIYGGTVNASSTYGVGIGGTAGSSIKIVGGLGSAKTEAGNTAIGCINNPGDYVDIGDDMRFYDSADKPITLPKGDEWAHQLAGMRYVKFAEADAKPLATPTAADFDYSNQGQSTAYDGQPKQITFITPKEGMDNITMKYQKNNGGDWSEDWGNATATAPIDPGQYKILISVDGGANYAASDGDIDEGWTFAINVAYVDRRWDENTKQVISTSECSENAQKITANTKELTGGWYFLYGEVEIDDAITVSGDAHIILTNGAVYTVNKGIAATNGAKLTFYDQIEDTDAFDKMGKVVIKKAYSGNAGIGSVRQGECGDITINGGTFVVEGGMNGAGIGAGADGKCGTVTVNGGKVFTIGGDFAAGIGSGSKMDDGYENTCAGVVINGGAIIAVGKDGAEHIGAGKDSDDVTVTFADGVDVKDEDDCTYVNIGHYPETEPSCADGHKEYFKNCVNGKYYTSKTLERESLIKDIDKWLAGEGFTGEGDGKHKDADKDGFCDGCGTLAKANINFYISHEGEPAFTQPCTAGEELMEQVDALAVEAVENRYGTGVGLVNYMYSDGNLVKEYDLVPFGIESMDIFAVLAFEEKEPDDTHDGHKIYYENTQDGCFYEDDLCTICIGDADALAEWLTTPVENGGGMIPKTGEPLDTPTADDFTFIPPASCVYDGQPKQASVSTDKDGMGEITVKYQKQNGSGWDTAVTEAPTEIGKYRVVISVEEGENYAASAADITSDSWVFEIIHTHDFTGDYVDNGDGTHSGVCECGDIDTVKTPHTYDETGKCTVCDCIPVIFKTMSLTLDGSIGVNFYVQINDMNYVGDNACMTMEFDNFGEKMTKTVILKDAEDLGNGKYKFTFYVNSLQMAEDINATFYYGEDESIAHTTSVKKYAEALVDGSTNPKSVELAKAILAYGYYAQLALQETHKFTLGTDGKYDAMPVPENTPDTSIDLSEYALTLGGANDNITALSMSLALDKKTDIYIYVTTDTEPTVTGADVEIEKVGERYRITIPNIAAHELATTYSLDIGGLTVDVSAFSYINSVLNSETRSDNYKKAVAALYEYYTAAVAYAAK